MADEAYDCDARVDRYVSGETLAHIGRGLGMSWARVHQVLNDAGAPVEALTPLHRAARSRLKEQADRQLVEQTLADLTAHSEVSALVGISEATETPLNERCVVVPRLS